MWATVRRINYELVVELVPDVVFLYGVEGNVTSLAGKLRNWVSRWFSVPSTWSRIHWVKPNGFAFLLRFTAGKLRLISFSIGWIRAIQLCVSISSSLDRKPQSNDRTALEGYLVCGRGKELCIQIDRRCRRTYLWHDNSSTEAVPLDLESVFSKAVLADIWINPGVANSMSELIAFDERFGELPVVKHGSIYNNNARMSPGGGNDYWESATIRPDMVLADLISVFHPQLMRDHSMFYYRKLK